MMPNGMLASEKWEEAGIGSQDFGAIVTVICELLVVEPTCLRASQSRGSE